MTTIKITETVTTTRSHRLTPAQREALEKLVTVGAWDVTAPAWLLGTWGRTGTVLRRLAAAGLARVDVNTYTVTDAGRTAYATVQAARS